MGRVLTNNTSLSVAPESSIGTLPANPLWKLLERNDLTTYGAEITTVARTPISKTRQRRKGTVVDKDAAVEFETDLTMDVFEYFIESWCFATRQNPGIIHRIQAGGAYQDLVSDATGTAFDHDAIANAIPQNTIVFSRKFTNSGNNGLWLVGAGSTTTTTEVTGLQSQTQVNETPGNDSGARLDVAGFRFSDLTYDDTGPIRGIGSASVDMTTLGWSVGQYLHVGGDALTTRFNDLHAFVGRISAITATFVTLVKLFNVGSGTIVGGGDIGVGQAVDVLYGAFIKNVSSDSASYLERSFTFELSLPNLGDPDTAYWYVEGCLCNAMAISPPLTNKFGLNLAFVGTDAIPPTETRIDHTNGEVGLVGTTAFNTSTDYIRLVISQADETGLTTCIKDWTLTLNNNVTPEKCQGTLGAEFMNTGNFDVDLEANILFTSAEVIDAIQNNETVSMEILIRNDDGGIGIDLPSMTLGDGSPTFEVNASVQLALTGSVFEDVTLGTSIGVSLFPYLPLIT